MGRIWLFCTQARLPIVISLSPLLSLSPPSSLSLSFSLSAPQVGTGQTVATLADASELPGTVTVAQVNYTVNDGEVHTPHTSSVSQNTNTHTHTHLQIHTLVETSDDCMRL